MTIVLIKIFKNIQSVLRCVNASKALKIKKNPTFQSNVGFSQLGSG